MLVRTLGTDIQIHAGSVAQALEEMEEHLRRHIPYFLTVELSVPNQPRTATEIQRHATQAIVHRKAIPITLDPSLITQRFQHRLAKGDRRILYRMMLVDFQVAFYPYRQVRTGMLTDLVQHMVEETKPGRDRCLSGSIQIPVHIDVRLLRGTLYDRTTLAGKQILGDLIPIIRDIGGRQ